MEEGVLFVPYMTSLDSIRRLDRVIKDLAYEQYGPEFFDYIGFAFQSEDDKIVALLDHIQTGETLGCRIDHADLWMARDAVA